ncbi:hypothetical protein ABT095_19760 [Kitasatospora sp. NPDC002227]|uniref:hypothetical protein n=1 Tax=Kitasatospora sp. NPDC002227 TaxID=3154773 RepID=UPI00333371AE
MTTSHWQVPLPLRISDPPKTCTVNPVSPEHSRDGMGFRLDIGMAAAARDVRPAPTVPPRGGVDGEPGRPDLV